MKAKYLLCCAAFLIVCFGTISGFGQQRKSAAQANAVCFDPNKPCDHKSKKFDVWELSFKMPARLAANKTFVSAPFYAVILETFESAEECDGGEFIVQAEAARKRAQKKFAGRKVFADYQCPNLSSVGYDFDGRFIGDKLALGNFIAVYAGTTKAEAEKILQSAKKDYPAARLKKMTANYERIVQ